MQENTGMIISSPVFILGTQRSGTTLLTRILSAHKDIFIQNELPLNSIFNREATRNDIIANIDSHFRKRYGHSVPNYLMHNCKTVWGLKDPQLTEHIDVLETHFTDSKYIILIRDPRAVVNSYIENKWGLGTTAYTGALRWNDEVKQQLNFFESNSDKCILIKYEDLLDSLETSMRKICEHLCLEFDSEMLAYHKKKMEYFVNSSNQNTQMAPDASAKDKWRKKFNSVEVNDVEYVCKDIMNILDYSLFTGSSRPNGLRIAYSKLHQAIVGECQIQYRLKVQPRVKRMKYRITEMLNNN